MERRIPIRRPPSDENMTGHRGALATMERKLHNFRLNCVYVSLIDSL
ncbi:MAG: hypothetical protein HDR86_03285 [Bacteroides sp.]|nr:hypothetical protein [Bacteroides sp.]